MSDVPAMAAKLPAGGDGSQRLRRRILGGVGWKLASQTFRQGSRLIVALILARLLTPGQFGIAAEVLVFSALVIVFGDLAFGAALIQSEEISEDDRSTAFWTSVAIGLALTLGGIALAHPIAGFYHQPQVAPLFAALALAFFITSLGSIQEALLTRDMNFRSLETRQMAATVGGSAVGIAVAATGGGAWAIILMAVTTSALSTVLLWVLSDWKPKLRWSGASLRRMSAFSGYILGHRLMYYLHRNADNLLIGRFIGAAALGAYAIGYNVILVPFSRLAAPIQDVLFPAFARIQGDPRRIAAGWIRATRVVAVVSIPSLVGLAILAPDFVTVVLGAKWHAATPVIQILAWVGILQSIQSLNTGILEAVGRAGAIFRWTIVFFAAHITAFVIGLQWGVIGVAAGYAISTTLIEPSYLWLTARAVGISPWTFLRALAGPVQASAAMAAAVIAAHAALVHAGLPPLARLVVCTAIGALVFLPLCWWRCPELRREALTFVRRRRPPAPEASTAAVATA